MKKVVLLLVIALVIGAVAWGQSFGTEVPDGSIVGDLFGRFDAVKTGSTESRYSAGIFGSDVDDYIDVRFHDPKIGTFLFLGGYPAADTVEETDNLTEGGDPYALSIGLGRTIGSNYFAVYYGGSFVTASGQYQPADKDVKDSKESTESDFEWKNNLAILFNPAGLGIGAFRFDLIMDGTTSNLKTEGGETTSKTRSDSPSIALTYGGDLQDKLGGLRPYITIGYKLSDLEINGRYDDDKYLQQTAAGGGAFGIQAGAWYALNEDASISADLVFIKEFATDYSGDITEENPYMYDGVNQTAPFTVGGATGFGIKVGFTQKVHAGDFSLGFSPSLKFGYASASNEDTAMGADNKPKPEIPSDDIIELKAGLDLGMRYKVNTVITLYTGASLTLFDWVTGSHSGGKEADDSTSWRLDGISWDTSQFNTDGNLGIGMTITPTENVVIGAGLNTFLDKLVKVNLQSMTLETGDFFAGDKNNVGSWAGSLLENLKFDLTVSAKF